MGMLIEKILPDGQSEKWVWDGIALVARGNDIYVNEPHVSGGIPILTKTDKGVRYHTSDILGTTLWSTDMKGNRTDSYADTNVFGEGSIQYDRSTRFTGKPYDEDLQAFVFPFRNYKSEMARWTSSDPSGFPDGINNHFYACVPTMEIDPLGMWRIVTTNIGTSGPVGTVYYDGKKEKGYSGVAEGFCTITFYKEDSDKKDTTFFYSYALLDSKGNSIKFINDKITLSASATGPIKVKVNIGYNYVNVKEGEYSYSFAVSTVTNPTPPRTFFVVEK